MKKNLLLVLSGAALLFSCGGGNKPVGSKVKVSVNVDNTQDASVVLGSEEAVVGTDFTTTLTLKKNSNADWKLSFDLKSVKSGTHDLTPRDYKYAPAADYSKADFGLSGSKIYGDVVITISLTQEERPTPTGWHEVDDTKGIEIATNIANHNKNNLPRRLSSYSNYELMFDGKTTTYKDCVSCWDADIAFQEMDAPATVDGKMIMSRVYNTYKGNKSYSLQRNGDKKMPAQIKEHASEEEAKKYVSNMIMANSSVIYYQDLINLSTTITLSTEHKLMSNDDSTSLYIYTCRSYSNDTEAKLTTVFSNYLVTDLIQNITSPDSHIISTSYKIDNESKIEIPEEAQNPEEWPTE